MIAHLRSAMIQSKFPLRVVQQVLEVIESSKIYSLSPHRRYVVIADNMGTLRISSDSEIDRPGTDLSIDVFDKSYCVPPEKVWKKILHPLARPSSESETT